MTATFAKGIYRYGPANRLFAASKPKPDSLQSQLGLEQDCEALFALHLVEV